MDEPGEKKLSVEQLNQLIQDHNESQAKIVDRAQDLVKSLLLLSGGALAVCANFFSAKVALPSSTVSPVQWAWVLLTSAMVLFGITLTLLLARDYFQGEMVSRQMNAVRRGDPDPDEPDLSKWWDVGIWSAGLTALSAFTGGMACFTFAAWHFLSVQLPISG